MKFNTKILSIIYAFLILTNNVLSINKSISYSKSLSRNKSKVKTSNDDDSNFIQRQIQMNLAILGLSTSYQVEVCQSEYKDQKFDFVTFIVAFVLVVIALLLL